MTADWRAETKPCARCGATFGPRLREYRGRWATHRYCSRTCARDRQRPPSPELTCAQCGTQFRTRERGRRFCSRACAMQSLQEEQARRRREMREAGH
jgi:hypothetical protein